MRALNNSIIAILVVAFCLINGVKAQKPPKTYYSLLKVADSLYSAGDYKNSALKYSAAFETFGWKGYIPDRYNAAHAWMLAHNKDSALFNIARIINRGGYSDYDELTDDTILAPLRYDSSWSKLIEQLKFNFLLDSMEKEDQKWRNMFTKISNNELTKISRQEVNSKVILVDSLNYPIIKDVFEKRGFIGFDQGGEVISNHFWLLVQHTDRHPDFQQAVLDKMKTEIDKNNASPSNYAYLVDRVKVNTHQLQVYGTQMQMNKDSTSFEPRPCINPDSLDERRKSMQLPTEDEYIRGMNEHYYGDLKKH